jgi:hypothetical protein
MTKLKIALWDRGCYVLGRSVGSYIPGADGSLWQRA